MSATIVRQNAANLLGASFGQAAYTTPTTPIKCHLDTAVGTDTAAGTEVTGGSYAAQTLTVNAPSVASYPASISSSNTPTYTNMPAATVTSMDINDTSGTPVRLWFGPLSASKTTNSGDTLTITSVSATLG